MICSGKKIKAGLTLPTHKKRPEAYEFLQLNQEFQ